jgi:hypothetical protein
MNFLLLWSGRRQGDAEFIAGQAIGKYELAAIVGDPAAAALAEQQGESGGAEERVTHE